MWTCSKCNEQLEDSFDSCWSCGAHRAGIPPAAEADSQAEEQTNVPDIHFECPKCNQPIDAPQELAAQLIDCPTCKEVIEVPVRSQHTEPPKPPEPAPKPASPPPPPAPTRIPKSTLPSIQISRVGVALSIIALLEFIAAPIAGLAVGAGDDGNVVAGWIVFLSGIISGLIFLGFASVIDRLHQSTQRLHRIELLIQRASRKKAPPNTALEPTATAPSVFDWLTKMFDSDSSPEPTASGRGSALDR